MANAQGITGALLWDMSTGERLYWANTDAGHGFFDEITPEEAVGIAPRWEKAKEDKNGRRKAKGEVFTPAGIVDEIVSSCWAGASREIAAPWLEVSCGEGAFMTTRYDAITGEPIPLADRVGFLDRKLALCTRLASSPAEWWDFALSALKASYGYEYQGDSLFLARKNAFLAISEAWEERWEVPFNAEQAMAAAGVICWNLWQMDGISECLPNPKFDVRRAKGAKYKKGGIAKYASSIGLIPAKVMDWRGEGPVEFSSVGAYNIGGQKPLLP